MKNILRLFLLLFIAFPGVVKAQLNQDALNRETQLQEKEKPYLQSFSFEESYVICYFDNPLSDGNSYVFEVFGEGKANNKVLKVPLEEGFNNIQTFYTEDTLYVVVWNSDNKFVLIKYDAANISTSKLEGAFDKKIPLGYFVLFNEYLYFTKDYKDKYYFVTLNTSSGKVNNLVMPLGQVDMDDVKMLSLMKSTYTNQLNIVYSVEESHTYSIYFMKADSNFQFSEPQLLVKNEPYYIPDLTLKELGTDSIMLFGEYRKRGKLQKNIGFYFLQQWAHAPAKVKRIPFDTIPDFYYYFDHKKTGSTLAKSILSGDPPEVPVYYMNTLENISQSNGYVFVAACYIEIYRNEMHYSSSGSTTQKVLDSYRLTHIVLIKYDTEGNILWLRATEDFPNIHANKIDDVVTVTAIENDKIEIKTFEGNIVRIQPDGVMKKVVNNPSPFNR